MPYHQAPLHASVTTIQTLERVEDASWNLPRTAPIRREGKKDYFILVTTPYEVLCKILVLEVGESTSQQMLSLRKHLLNTHPVEMAL